MTTLAFLSESLGTLWWSVLCFVAGGLIGVPLWAWIKTKAPWNK